MGLPNQLSAGRVDDTVQIFWGGVDGSALHKFDAWMMLYPLLSHGDVTRNVVMKFLMTVPEDLPFRHAS